MTMEERKAKGLLWTDTEEAMAAQRKARGLCYDFNHIHPSESDRRNAMLPDIFGEVGEDVWIEPQLTCAFGKTVKIGRGTYINSNLTLVDDYKITIGDNSVIGAGSVVLRDVPANTVAAGNPCKVIREITDRDLEYYYKDYHV